MVDDDDDDDDDVEVVYDVPYNGNSKNSKDSRGGRSNNQNQNRNTTTTTTTTNNNPEIVRWMVGHYSMPSQGRYFLEVIGLFCNGPQWNVSFQEICMEDPTTHRITKDTALIHVTVSSRLEEEAAFGYWEWSPSHHHQQQQQQPLLTRYQPQNCQKKTDQEEKLCRVAISMDRFEPY